MVIIKKSEEIELIREGGIIIGKILRQLEAMAKPGATTGELEEAAIRLIKEAGGRPSFKGYRQGKGEKPFPTALCASVNNEVVHVPALPARELKEGDIIGLDIGMEYPAPNKRKGAPKNKRSALGGYYTDTALTAAVGKISPEAEKLINVTRKSLELAIAQVKPGNSLRDIARAVQTYAEKNGFSVVRDLVGHGVGVAVHEDPRIPNYVINSKDCDVKLVPGMVIAIEPMVNAGGWRIIFDNNGLAIRTVDGSLSAHFEHTVAVTENGYEILTK